MQKVWTVAALVALSVSILAPSAVFAANCRDAKGKFVKCAAVAKASVHCRDATTKKFAKCSMPGTEPVP